jgi:hypothetical protein
METTSASSHEWFEALRYLMMRHLTEVHISLSEIEEARQCLEFLIDFFLEKTKTKKFAENYQEELICLDLAMMYQKLGSKEEALVWMKGALSSSQFDIRILALVHTLFLFSDNTERVILFGGNMFFTQAHLTPQKKAKLMLFELESELRKVKDHQIFFALTHLLSGLGTATEGSFHPTK